MNTKTVLNQIVEGMDVYDSTNVYIGTIEAYRVGEGTIKTSQTDVVTIAERISETIGSNTDLPGVLYKRLYQEGFVYVPRGFLRPNLLIFLSQINNIKDEQVYLNVKQDELLKA